MNIDRIVLAFAGTVILFSLALGLLTGFVGLNRLQVAFSKICPLAIILGKFGVKPGQAFNQAPANWSPSGVSHATPF